MEPGSIQRMKLRAFDLSERTTEYGRRSLRRRSDRLRNRWFFIAQCAITAGLAWFVAAQLLDHRAPAFAPVAAIICLGVTFGNRLRRGVEVALGVAVGVAVGDLFVLLFGTGVWQVVVVVALSMVIATLVGAGQLMLIQAGVQALIVTTLLPNPSLGFDRWLDAVVGCALALAIATITPGAPIRRPGTLAAETLKEFAATLDAAAAALRAGDAEAADAVLTRARASETQLTALEEASKEGLAMARQSLFRRSQLPAVQAYADLSVPLYRASNDLRVLARRCAVVLWRNESVPPEYLVIMEQTADAARLMGRDLFEGHLFNGARQRLIDAGVASSHLTLHDSLSAVVILAQTRSILADLLQLTGMDYADARDLIPGMD